jgi:protein TonB
VPPPAPDPVVALPEPPKETPPPIKEEPKRQPVEVKEVQRTRAAPRTTAAPRSERNTADKPSAPAQGASAAAALASWRDQVVAQLQRAKRYPGGAESRREQGVATLTFTLGRNGAVLSRNIARSSGHPELDQEVLAMVMRAQPFPAFPASMTQPRVSLSVPVRFSLR